MATDFANLGDELMHFLNSEEVLESTAKTSQKEDENIVVSEARRERILQMVDVSNMDAEEHAVFMDYGIANAVKNLPFRIRQCA